MDRNQGLIADPLFVGVTRPAMRWGVAYPALLLNLVITMEIFLLTKNLLTLLISVPIHAVSALFCMRDARFFELAALWLSLRLPALVSNLRFWKASSYSPLLFGRSASSREVHVTVYLPEQSIGSHG